LEYLDNGFVYGLVSSVFINGLEGVNSGWISQTEIAFLGWTPNMNHSNFRFDEDLTCDYKLCPLRVPVSTLGTTRDSTALMCDHSPIGQFRLRVSVSTLESRHITRMSTNLYDDNPMQYISSLHAVPHSALSARLVSSQCPSLHTACRNLSDAFMPDRMMNRSELYMECRSVSYHGKMRAAGSRCDPNQSDRLHSLYDMRLR
jgi:hypothetical protein